MIRIYKHDIGMEFGIEKCAMLIIKSEKRHITEGIEQSNQERISMLGERETYKYLGILEADTIKQVVMKENMKKEYIRRAKKLLETKLCSRNLIERINTYAVSFVRYSGLFLKWTREELRLMDQRTRKLMSIHMDIHTRNDRLCVRKKGRGFASMEDNVDASIQGLEENIKRSKKDLL